MRARPAATVLVSAVLVLAGCSGGSDEDSAEPSAGPTDQPSASTADAPTEAAEPPPAPADRACYDLDYDAALAPTATDEPVDCDAEHTARTFAVGELDLVADGHLLAVDSRRAQEQPAQQCPARLAEFLGGTPDDLRLSVLRSVWFSPTVEQSDEGADWYRCDVIALAGDGALAPLGGGLEGLLSRPDDAERWRVCGTAEPGTDGFERVPCSAEHSWRALSVVELTGAGEGGQDYPGTDAVSGAGQGPCEDAGRDAASDPLNFRWGYEFPTAEQWDAGQRYGLCWVPA